MKHVILATALLLSCIAEAQITETATQAVINMGLGWNLGNTLDANVSPSVSPSDPTYWGQQDITSENCWGQPTTKEELLTMMHTAGVGAIRVPVTWYNHMTPAGVVDAAWMARVHEVVDYVINNGMYCILNVHHDTGADDGAKQHWIKADEVNFSANQSKFEALWRQIANEFKDYGKELIFESYNEMLDNYSSWCFASFNAPGQYNSTVATSAYNAINQYAQSFVNTVRATGGNNATRNLVVNTYAACCGVGSWNAHLQEPLTRMQRPTDSASDRIIFQVHSYPSLVTSSGSNRSITEINREIDQMMSDLQKNLASKGGPVIIGEWGTSNVDAGPGKNDYDARRTLMLQFAEHFVQAAKAKNIGTFYWMGLSDGLVRSLPAFNQPDLAECLAKAYHGNDFVGEYPIMEAVDSMVCFEGQKQLNWGDGISISAEMVKTMGQGMKLQLTYKQTGNGDDIQFYYGDWSAKFSFKAEGNSYTADFNPSRVYNTPTGTVHTTEFTFDAATYNQLATKGIVIHGANVQLLKAVLYAGPKTALEEIRSTLSNDNIYYNLLGQPVAHPSQGFYIINGKKVIIR